MHISMKRSATPAVLLALALAVTAGAEAQGFGDRPPFTLETSAVQLSTSNRASLWGGPAGR